MKVELIEKPNSNDWLEVKRRALVTIGKKPVTEPTEEWKHKILRARHSPIRRLHFSFYIECPYWVSVHLCRHIHAQPYVKSQRNDRQSEYDRKSAQQNETVSMIWDMNAEELMVIANKRLCGLASEETREVVNAMCNLVKEEFEEFRDLLVPYCNYWGKCQEMYPCYRRRENNEH